MSMHVRPLLLAIAMCPLVASAQPLFQNIHSIEAQTLNSEYIGVGRILDLQSPTHINATVQVELVIKGGLMVGKMGLMVKGSPEQLEKWRASGARLIILDESTVDLGDPRLEMITSEGKFLRRADEVVRTMRRVTEENPGVYRIQTCSSRDDISLAGSLQLTNDGRYPRLIVPADRKLESWCYETITKSKDQRRRARAVSALRLFPGERATAKLRELLSDPSTVEESNGKHRYAVRMAAWEALRVWDDTVPKPAEYRGG